jgi:mRNA-degrading endonuclease toxin of MazEF toxin-antitoxin module
MYTKYFDEWNIEKQSLNQENPKLYPKEREIWNLKLGINIWSEADGKRGFYRPVLILKKIGSMYLVVPMTSKWKLDSPYYYTLSSIQFHDGKWQPITSSLMVSHIRTVDVRRFYKHKATLPLAEFENIQKLLQKTYFERNELFPSS